jgi:rhamnosyl/mannosyltransferase
LHRLGKSGISRLNRLGRHAFRRLGRQPQVDRMRIVHIYKDYSPVLGGIENHVRMLAEAQAARGHRVTVLVCTAGWRSHRETCNGVTLVRASRLATIASMPLSVGLPVALAGMESDILHMHSPFPLGEVAGFLLARAGARVITYHSDIVRQRIALRVYGPLFRRILAATDTVIATSSRYIATSPWLNAVQDRCTVIPLAVDVSRFRPGDGRPGSAAPHVLFVGKLRYYKDLDTLLRALLQIPEARLTIVGDGPMRQTWQERVGALGLVSRVRFEGEVADAGLAWYYQTADLLVLPSNSRAEAFGTVLLEAMASGLPVVSTELGTGTSWVNLHGVTGWVVPPGDPDGLARAIRGLLDDSALRQRMGHAGRARVVAEFSLEKMIGRVETAYENALARRRVSCHRAPMPAD